MSADLLAAVLAKPDDNVARATYAAHLRSANDARGEFIDLQLDHAKHANPKTPAAKKLLTRFTELHKKHSAKWAKPLRALGKKVTWEFHRGFVRRLVIDGEPRIAALNDVFAIEPVTELVLRDAGAQWFRGLLATAGARRLERLAVLSVPPENAATVAALVKAELPRLAHLRMGLLGDAELRALAAAKLPALRQLAVGCGGHGVEASDTGVAALLKSPLGKKLTTFELGRTEITPRMANLVCATKLERFSASMGEYDFVKQQLKARFGKAFVEEDEASFDYLLIGTKGIGA